MKANGPDGQAATVASQRGSELLGAAARREESPPSPVTCPSNERAALPNDVPAAKRIVPQAPHRAAVIRSLASEPPRALAPTVAGWTFGAPNLSPEPEHHSHRPDPPVSAVVERPAPQEPSFTLPPPPLVVDEALASVGLKPGDVIDRTYRVERTLGTGGMGVVALAHDQRLDRRVAIKLIKPELFAFPEMRTFFDNEARAMARVSHPNVIHVYAFGEHNQVPYFVMEYVEGRTVEHWLREREPGTFPDLDEAVRILDQACLGVEAIHASQTVHRDIKPSNLLYEESQTHPNGRVRVGDLGVARILEFAPSANVVVGSALYMAPEAALAEEEAGGIADRRDIYALGCLAYELFTGRPPFLGATDMNVLSQHVLSDPPRPSEHRPTLSPGFDEILLRALAKDPHRRYASVGAFRRALLAEHAGMREPERILVVDDDEDWREIIGDSLRERFPDAEVHLVQGGAEALAAWNSAPYSVVLVDLEMPEIDGAKLTGMLRAEDTSRRTPIIVLTAAGGPKEWQQLSRIGADAFLVKPVIADDVELLIRRTLRSRRGFSRSGSGLSSSSAPGPRSKDTSPGAPASVRDLIESNRPSAPNKRG